MHHAEIEEKEKAAAMAERLMREPMADAYNELVHGENRRTRDEAYTDTVNHPAHYTQGDIECIDVLEQLAGQGHDFRILNAMKYLWRYRQKGGAESLRKAVWYVERVINNG